MSKPHDRPESRREFFRGIARGVALGALGAVAGVLFERRRARVPHQKCINRGICSRCASFDDCVLPQALSAKEARRRP